MTKVYEFLRSVKTAVVLLLIITVLSIFSTFIPQDKDEGFYQENFPGIQYSLLQITRMHHFSTSMLFLLPVILFTGSLGVCTVDRMARRFRSRARHRYGPDLIHIGILVLIVGSLITASLRKEIDFNMVVGDEVEITGGYRLTLLSYKYLRYDDGRPKSWTSTVRGTKDGKTIIDSFGIEVNKPLNFGPLVIYQVNFGGVVHLKDAQGNTAAMMTGQGIAEGNSTLVLAALENPATGSGALSARIEEWKGDKFLSSRFVGNGDSIGPYIVQGMSEYTGLKAVDDPGYLTVLIALLISSFGLMLTFIQKKWGKKS